MIRRLVAFAAILLASLTLIVAPAHATTRTKAGYWMLTDNGHVYGFGGAADLGSPWAASGHVHITPSRSGNGYWVLHAAGIVDNFGDAPDLGGGPYPAAGERYTTMAATPTGKGYWLFTNTGRVFRFGDATWYGDMSGTQLAGPVLDAVATPTGLGYYMVASDGGIFTFGDAHYNGSMGGQHLNKPVMSMAVDADGDGYWLVASDGGIFAFNAPFFGSAGSLRLNRPISGIVASPTGGGYLMVAQDGGIFTYGDVPFYGSLGGNPPAYPVVAVAAIGDPPPPEILAWEQVAKATGASNTTSAPFHLNANTPVKMAYSCLTPTGEGSGCLVEVKNVQTGEDISGSWMQPDPNETGNVILNPTADGDYVIHGNTYDWRQATQWTVTLDQQICQANCQQS